MVSVVDLVGKRCLLRIRANRSTFADTSGVEEYRLLEASPSGNWLRLQNAYGNKFWRAVAEVSFVEELRDIRADKPTS